MQGVRRVYRRCMGAADLSSFTVKVKESDLWIAVDRESYRDGLAEQVEQLLWRCRHLLDCYIKEDPGFAAALSPYLVSFKAPPLVLEMVRAANRVGVGPMASVAGAVAAFIGDALLSRCRETIVENGGDIFLYTTRERRIAVYAGDSPFSGKIALRLQPRKKPFAVCTSSGTVGASLSYGSCDACVVISDWVALADACATATCNLVKSEEDLEEALAFARNIEGIDGVLLVCGERIVAWGNIEIVPV
jgi:ApbE superfamily uncharacterized protein (UPF0280 family)